MSDQGRQVAKVAALVAGGAVIGAGLDYSSRRKRGQKPGVMSVAMRRRPNCKATRWSRTVQSGVKEVMDCSKALIRKDEQKPRIEAA